MALASSFLLSTLAEMVQEPEEQEMQDMSKVISSLILE